MTDENHHMPSYPITTSFVRKNDGGPTGDAGDNLTPRQGADRGFGGYDDNSLRPNWCCPDNDGPTQTAVAPFPGGENFSAREKSDLDYVGPPSRSDEGKEPVPKLVLPKNAHSGDVGPSGRSGSGRTAQDWAKDQQQFSHLPKLPDGWIRVRSRTTDAVYYCYVETGETTFTEPTGPPASKRSGGTSDLPAGWVEMVSRTTGRTYFWNSQLQKSQFERPTAVDGGGDVANSNGELPAGWIQMVSRSTGRTYFFNASLQKSQYEKPTTADG